MTTMYLPQLSYAMQGIVHEQDTQFPIEFLNTLRFPGLSNHELDAKEYQPKCMLEI